MDESLSCFQQHLWISILANKKQLVEMFFVLNSPVPLHPAEDDDE